MIQRQTVNSGLAACSCLKLVLEWRTSRMTMCEVNVFPEIFIEGEMPLLSG